MADISTLVEDIYEVIRGNGGWDSTVTKLLAEGIAGIAEERCSTTPEVRDTIGLSSVGTPCQRKLWYKVHLSGSGGKSGDAEQLGTFFYGDLLEVLVTALAKAAGHRVEGMQTKLDVYGIKGHRDCIIDGMTVDVKSASQYSFQKFAAGNLRKSDSFGYISQLSSYVVGGKDDPLVLDKTRGAFLVVRKDRFQLCLDVHDFTEEIKNKEKEISDLKAMLADTNPPDVPYKEKKYGTSGNLGLNMDCAYCSFKKLCWERLRVFQYADGPVYLTEVKKAPRVKEITEEFWEDG